MNQSYILSASYLTVISRMHIKTEVKMAAMYLCYLKKEGAECAMGVVGRQKGRKTGRDRDTEGDGENQRVGKKGEGENKKGRERR